MKAWLEHFGFAVSGSVALVMAAASSAALAQDSSVDGPLFVQPQLAAKGSSSTYTVNGVPCSVQNGGAAYAFSISGQRRRSIIRFEVHGGDFANIDAKNHTFVDRTELDCGVTPAGQLPWFTDTWVSYAFLLEPRLTDAPQDQGGSINQIHQTPDPNDMAVSPPFALWLDHDGRLNADYRWDPNSTTTTFPKNTVIWRSPAPVERGVWHYVVERFRPDYRSDGDGKIQIWYDGMPVANYSGPWTYNDVNPNYFKFGIYRGQGHSPEVAAIQFANMEIGQRDLSGRISSPLSPY